MGKVVAPSGTVLTDTQYHAGNRFVGKAYDKLKPYEGLFDLFTNAAQTHMNSLIGDLRNWQQALMEVGDIFPPFTAAAIALGGVISTLTAITKALTITEKALAAMRNLSGPLSVLKGTALGNTVRLFGETITNALGGIITKVGSALVTKIVPFITKFAIVLGPIAAVIIGIVAALKLSQDSHDKYLAKLREENKEVKAQDKANQAAFKNIKQQRKHSFGRTRNNRAYLERQYELAEKRLEASQKKRHANVMKMAREENDGTWGTYGLRAQYQKMDWLQAFMRGNIVGVIAKALAGEFQSTASDYKGTTEQIRKVKEYTVGKQPWQLTGAEKRVAAYYDAHQPAFAMMDEYKSELGELYDKETKFVRTYGSVAAARNNKRFQRAVDEFTEATGINKETAYQMLDYMQMEHVMEEANKQMQAHADSIVANAENQALAIEFGQSPEDAMGLNGVQAQQDAMIRAQADMVKQQAADTLWWKATWTSFTALFYQIISPVTLVINVLKYIFTAVMAIYHAVANPLGTLTGTNDELNNDLYNLDAAGKDIQSSMGDAFGVGREGQKANAYWKAYNEVQKTDFNSIGRDAIDAKDRADYGSGGKMASVMTGAKVPKSNPHYQQYIQTPEPAKYPAQSDTNGQSYSVVTMNGGSRTAKAGMETFASSDGVNFTEVGRAAQDGMNNVANDMVEGLKVAPDEMQRTMDTMVGIGGSLASGSERTFVDTFNEVQGHVKNISNKTDRNERTLRSIDSGSGAYNRMKNHTLFKKGPDLIDLLLGKYRRGKQDEELSPSDIIKGLFFSGGQISKVMKSFASSEMGQNALQMVDDATGKVGELKKMSKLYKGLKIDGHIKDSKDALTKAYKAVRHPIKTLFGHKVQTVDPVTKDITTAREGGLINKIRKSDALKNAKQLTKNNGEVEGLINTVKNLIKGSDGYKSFSEQVAASREINAWAKNSGMAISTSNFDNMVQIFDDAKLAYTEDGLLAALKASGKGVTTKNLANIGKWGWNTAKTGIVEGLSPRIAYEGLKEIGGGAKTIGSGIKGGEMAVVKAGGKAATKGVLKSVPIIGSLVGGAMTFGEEWAEHDPNKTHYNEDGTEKRAFQSSGEVLGSTVGSVAGGLGGAAIGAEIGATAGATLGSVVPGIGTGIGAAAGTVIGGFAGALVGEETMRRWGDELGSAIGWVADETINNPAFKSGEFFHYTMPVMFADGLSSGAKMLFGDDNPVSNFILSMEEKGGEYWQWIQEQAGSVFNWLSGILGGLSDWLGQKWNDLGNWAKSEEGHGLLSTLKYLPGGIGAIAGIFDGAFNGDGSQQEGQNQENNQQNAANLANSTISKKNKPGYFATHKGLTNYSSGGSSMPAPIHRPIMDVVSNGNTKNLSQYQGSSGNGNTTNLTRSKSKGDIAKSIGGDSSSVVIKNININTDDDPEKIKTSLMNLVIELQEQISPRLVSRTIGEPPATSADTEEDTNLKEDENAANQQNGINTNNNNNNPIT